MTVLADIAVETAHDIVRSGLVARHGMPLSADGREQEFIIIGMGKLGGRELNVSSDIDLIYGYPEDGSTAGPKIIDNFRVLHQARPRHHPGPQRPHRRRPGVPGRHAPASQRRLRPAGGELRHARELLHHPGPRMGALRLDQGPRDDRHPQRRAGRHRPPLHLPQVPRLRRHQRDARTARPDPPRGGPQGHGPNVKLGPGGIREIEFLGPGLPAHPRRARHRRCRSSHPGARPLAERGIMPPRGRAELAAAYDFLRRVEHRLQYLDDAQTHNLPAASPKTRRSSPAAWASPLRSPSANSTRTGRSSAPLRQVFRPGNPTEAGRPRRAVVLRCRRGAAPTSSARLGYPDAAAAASSSLPPASGSALPADAAEHPDALRC